MSLDQKTKSFPQKETPLEAATPETGQVGSSMEERIKALEMQVAELRRMFGLPGTDKAALDAAIVAIVENQDVSVLDRYLKLGGKIPVSPVKKRLSNGVNSANP